MAVWAIAWAGSKPVASLADGLLPGWIGLKWTGFVLATPALVPLAVLIGLMIFFFFARGRWKPQPDRWLARRWDTLESSEMYQHAEIHLINVSGVAAGNALGTVDLDR